MSIIISALKKKMSEKLYFIYIMNTLNILLYFLDLLMLLLLFKYILIEHFLIFLI